MNFRFDHDEWYLYYRVIIEVVYKYLLFVHTVILKMWYMGTI